jgi:hypothetical protein
MIATARTAVEQVANDRAEQLGEIASGVGRDRHDRHAADERRPGGGCVGECCDPMDGGDGAVAAALNRLHSEAGRHQPRESAGAPPPSSPPPTSPPPPSSPGGPLDLLPPVLR